MSMGERANGYPGLAHYLKGVVFTSGLAFENQQYRFRFQGTGGTDQVPADRIYLNHDILLPILHASAIPRRHFHVIHGETVARLPGVPPLLGWREDGTPLEAQLEALARRLKDRRHVRFLLLGPDGGLGDTIIKVPAYRALESMLSRVFGDRWLLDFATLPAGSLRKDELLWATQGPGRIRRGLLTVADLLAYDGLFSVMGIKRMAPWGTEPIVDMTLRLLGLRPDELSDADKRPRLAVERAAWTAMAHRLGQLPPGPRVLFNPTASGALRSFPERAAVRFAQALVAQHPRMQLILPMPLPVSHPRIHNWGPLPDFHHLSALVGQVDGQITVDTFTLHAGDVFDLPTVTLSSTVEMADFFPYYPANEGLTVPGTPDLPGWGRDQIADEAEWMRLAPAYEKAWGALDPSDVWARLYRRLTKRVPAPAPFERMRFLDQARRPVPLWRRVDGVLRLYGERVSERWRRMETAVGRHRDKVFRPGMRVLWLTPGSLAHLEQIAQQLWEHGRLHLLEPREPLRRLLRHRLADSHIVQVDDAYVWPSQKRLIRPRLVPWRDFSPYSWGNADHLRSGYAAAPFEAARPYDLVVIQPPSGLLPSWEGLERLLESARPDVLLLGYDEKLLLRLLRLWREREDDYVMWTVDGQVDMVLCTPSSRVVRDWKRLDLEG